MDLFQAVVLGIVQGITEFLPISSSGHLILIPAFFGWEEGDSKLTFDIALHLGTTLALLIFFWKTWKRLLTGFLKQLLDSEKNLLTDSDSRLFLILVLGSLPAAVIGIFFEDIIESQVRQTWVVGVTLIVFAIVLKLAASRVGEKTIERIRLRDGLIIGFWQALALIPGVSRSGSTISGGLFQGLQKEAAAKFSFLLATPVVLGAALLKIKDLIRFGTNGEAEIFLAGFLSSLMVGLLVIKLLLDYIRKHSFDVFIWYRLALGTVIIILSLLGILE